MADPTIPTAVLPRLQPGTDAGRPATAATPEQAPEFRRILESLERLARSHATPANGGAPAATPADGAAPAAVDATAAPDQGRDLAQLDRALATADDGFATAMDLRRRLEDAFRNILR